MEDNIIGKIKQPVESSGKRGMVLLAFSALMLLYMIFMNDEFQNTLQTTKFALLLPILCFLFLLSGAYIILIVNLNRELKDIRVKINSGKLTVNAQCPFTSVFSKNRLLEINYPLSEIKLVTGNLKGSVVKWWNLILKGGDKTVTVKIVKENYQDAVSIVNIINKETK